MLLSTYSYAMPISDLRKGKQNVNENEVENILFVSRRKYIYSFEIAYSHPYLSIIFATRNGLRRVASERSRRRLTFHRIENIEV